jgi:hypothetical protein
MAYVLKGLAAALLIVLVSALVAASVHFTLQVLDSSESGRPKAAPAETATPFGGFEGRPWGTGP